MAGSVNKVVLVGNLGKDPEIHSLQSGGRVCNLTIATSESWKDKASGERKEKTEWHRVVIWNDGLVGVAEQYLRKGAKVYIEGQLETRKWQDQQGQDRYSTEVVLKPYKGELQMLGSRQDGDGAHDAAEPAAASYGGGAAGTSGYVRSSSAAREGSRSNYRQPLRLADDRRPATADQIEGLNDEIPF